jgi:hypothetical protein
VVTYCPRQAFEVLRNFAGFSRIAKIIVSVSKFIPPMFAPNAFAKLFRNPMICNFNNGDKRMAAIK